MEIKIVLSISLIFLTSICAKKTREICSLTRDSLDLCSKQLLILGDGHSLPETEQELEKGHCRRVFEAINCVENYAENCLKKFAKKAAKMMISNATTIISEVCVSNGKHLLPMSPCLNQKTIQIRECMEKYIKQLEAIRDKVDNKELIMPYTCCQMIKLKTCFMESIGTCGENVDQLVNRLLKPLELMVCLPNWDQTYKCPNLESLEPKSDSILDRALSPIGPMIDILNHLEPIDKCMDLKEKVDNYAVRLLVFGDRELRFATNAQELNSFCLKFKETIERMTQFDEQCLKSNETTYMSDIIKNLIIGAKQQHFDRCEKEDKNLQFEHSECLNRKLDSLHLCYDEYTTEMEVIAYEFDNQEFQISYICCRFHSFKKCASEAIKECNNKTNTYLSELITKTSKDFFQYVCKDNFDSIEICEALGPVDTNTQLDIRNVYKSYAQSFVRPLIDMFAPNIEY